MKGIVIVARTRTGTNWLRETLAACTTGENLGEVLRADERFDGNFFTWFEATYGEMPTYRGQTWVADVLNGYFDHAEANYPVPIFDLKYSGFAAFEPSWRSPLDLPVFLHLLFDRGYRVIHQRRESFLDTSVSEAVAALTGVYTAHALPLQGPALQLDVEDVVREASEYRSELDFVTRMLAGRARVAELSYEAMLAAHEGGTLSALLRGLISGTDVEFQAMRSVGLKRLLPDWRSTVSNWQEVEAAGQRVGLR